MTEKTVYYWEVYCTTDSKYEFVWSPTEPTTCPTNAAHTISTNPGPIIKQTISDHTVALKEEIDGETQGIYKLRGYIQNVPSGTPGNVTTLTHTFPYPITLMNGWFISTEANKDDCFDVSVADNTIVGAIAAPVYSGNSTVTVTSTVLDNVYKGYYITLTDGVNADDMGEVISIDPGNSQITCTNSSTNNYNPLSPTYVQMTVKVMEKFHINLGGTRYAFAEKKIGGKYIPSNIPINIHYTNSNGNAKVFSYNFEYMY